MRMVTWILLLATITGFLHPATALTDEERSTIAAHERVARSVVLILARGFDSAESGRPAEVVVSGSGFAIEPGLVVTNYHVVEKAAEIEIVLQDGDHAGAVIVGTAPGFDLALLRVPIGSDRLPPVAVGSGFDLAIGQKVLTVSNPLGIWHSATSGIVSGHHRELPGLELGPSLIQFDAPLNRGQSGGPLVDSEGRVVGVTTAKIPSAEAIGFAIPVEIVTRILPDLKEMGHPFRPRMGFQGTTVDAPFARLFDLPAQTGVVIDEVEPGSVAERAGLEGGHRRVALGGREYVLGGDIIVSVNEVPVRGSDDLMLRFLSARPGDELVLSVVGARGRRKVTLVVPEMVH